MKILYGVQQTGNGHITRSIKMINSLVSKGIDVDIIVSGNNSQLDFPLPIKDSFKGLTLHYTKNGSINWVKTCIKSNILKLLSDISYDVSKYDLVISDFEPISAWAAKLSGIRSIGLGNQYSFMSSAVPVIPGNKLSKFFTKNFAPCVFSLGIHYVNYDSNIFQPIISDDFLNKQIRNSGFYLVYLPSINFIHIIQTLNKCKESRFILYTPNIKEDLIIENTAIKCINKKNFTHDMIGCSGIITASGFSTTSESLFLQKKLWSIPVKNHYEQLSNAKALSQLGVYTEDFTYKNLITWIKEKNSIVYSWEDPTEQMINKIVSIYEN